MRKELKDLRDRLKVVSSEIKRYKQYHEATCVEAQRLKLEATVINATIAYCRGRTHYSELAFMYGHEELQRDYIVLALFCNHGIDWRADFLSKDIEVAIRRLISVDRATYKKAVDWARAKFGKDFTEDKLDMFV